MTLVASRGELAVYQALIWLGISFEFQSSFYGGRMEKGGLVADFYIPEYSLAINVQSDYWHYGNPQRMAEDRAQQIAMESQGIRFIYIDEEDALRNAGYYVQEALEGRDHSRMTR